MGLIDIVAEWRERERKLEAGLDRELAQRLDDLRAEHARLISKSSRPRLALLRALEPSASPSPTDSPRPVETLTPAVASVKPIDKTKPTRLAAWRKR